MAFVKISKFYDDVRKRDLKPIFDRSERFVYNVLNCAIEDLQYDVVGILKEHGVEPHQEVIKKVKDEKMLKVLSPKYENIDDKKNSYALMMFVIIVAILCCMYL